MGLFKIVSLLVHYFIISSIQLQNVLCQEENDKQCIPKKTFLALLLLPGMNSNLAAYSRSARINQDPKIIDDFETLRMNIDENAEGDICLPVSIYSELVNHPIMQEYLTTGSQVQKYDEIPEPTFTSEKRSLSTLAKNGDLPVLVPKREESVDDYTKNLFSRYFRSTAKKFENLDDAVDQLQKLLKDNDRRYVMDMARETLFPNGKVDVETLVRNYNNKKSAVGFYDDSNSFFKEEFKRNVAVLARDHALPNRSGNIKLDKASLQTGKRSVAILAKNGDWPEVTKRNFENHVQNRREKALNLTRDAIAFLIERSKLDDETSHADLEETKRKINWKLKKIVSEYLKLLEYNDAVEALLKPTVQKRFMGRIPQMGPRPTTPPTRRLGR